MLIPIIVTKVAATIGISANLLFAICQTETGFQTKNNFTDGHGGSYGICELNLKTARSFEPWVDMIALQQNEVNLRIAAKYIKKLQLKYNNNSMHSAAAFNAGYARIADGEYLNADYVNKVRKVMDQL